MERAGDSILAPLVNDVSSPYGTIGSRMGETDWRWVAEGASKVLDAGSASSRG